MPGVVQGGGTTRRWARWAAGCGAVWFVLAVAGSASPLPVAEAEPVAPLPALLPVSRPAEESRPATTQPTDRAGALLRDARLTLLHGLLPTPWLLLAGGQSAPRADPVGAAPAAWLRGYPVLGPERPPWSPRRPVRLPSQAVFAVGCEALDGAVDRLVTAAVEHPSIALSVAVIGHSQQGRPLRLVTLRDRTAPVPTVVMAIARQHGNEPAGSYGLLRLLRLLLTATDPALRDLPRRVTLRAVVNANPDGSAAFRRWTACGANPNRDWLDQQLPETQAVAAVVAAQSPLVLLDLHEQIPGDTEGAFVMGLPMSGAPWLLHEVRRTLRANGSSLLVSDGGLTDTHLLGPWFAARYQRPALLVESRWVGSPSNGLERRARLHQMVVLAALRAAAAKSGR